MKKRANNNCPCGSGMSLETCCQQYISREKPVADPETLMRSRYTAYCLNNTEYLLSSWHASTRPATLDADNDTKWIRLKIISSSNSTVEFIATCRLQGKAHKLHETSRFIYENNIWYYLDGVLHKT